MGMGYSNWNILEGVLSELGRRFDCEEGIWDKENEEATRGMAQSWPNGCFLGAVGKQVL